MTSWKGLAAAVLLGLFVPALGMTSTISLNGSGNMSYTYQFLWTTGPGSPASTSNDYNLQVPGQYLFSDQFTTQQTGGSPLATSSVGSYDFMDSYRFTIGPAASGDSLITTLGLGGTFNIGNLQFRLYQVATSTTAPVIPGLPSGSTLVKAWQGPATASSPIQDQFNNLSAGTYIMDIAGTASGSQGGSYYGSLNLVPLPGALPLLLSGLAGVGLLFARRRSELVPTAAI